MTQYERELSNLSYVNKDFGTIYPELLDLTKKLSYKWDPTISDESDPGVVLLKLAALMADKNNYNIDKNILELFPLSVTQDTNARQIFNQCGYTMKYYRSAATLINLTMIAEPEITENDRTVLNPTNTEFELDKDINTRTYIIPKYSMVSDSDNEHVYTLLQDVTIKSDGITVSVEAMEGTAIQYTINGESLITTANLDYNNRLYFTGLNIAENGIFISSSSGPSRWERVDNLVIQPTGSQVYKFDLTEDGSTCYIEFPSDIDNIIGEGIYITYLSTSGLEGNIGKKRLIQFYTDIKATRYLTPTPSNSQEVTITTDNIYIINPLPSTGGKNPETIDEAYKNYERIKTTFETLVSLKDYTNFMISNHNVSNGYVCDRGNDIQSTYYIKNKDGNNTKTSTIYVQNEAQTKNRMSAFDLKVYALKYHPTPYEATGFITSFQVIDEDTDTLSDMYKLNSDIYGWGEIKTIQHDFQPYEDNEIMMIKNKYPIQAKIIPQYKITNLQQKDILAKVYNALYAVLNSQQLKFGDPIEYDIIYDTILGADPRIRAIILEDIDYYTYAVYKSTDGQGHSEIKELRIDSTALEPTDETEKNLFNKFRKEIITKNILAGSTQFLKSDNKYTYSVQQGKEVNLNDNIYRITSNTEVTVSNVDENNLKSVTSRKLRENENILFTAPNLVTDQQYSTYTKFLYKFNESNKLKREINNSNQTETVYLPSNSDYTLDEGEYIVFFWKDSDEDGAPYKYHKYTNATTINTFSPNFNMVGGQELPQYRINDTTTATPEVDFSTWPESGYTDGFKFNSSGGQIDATKYLQSIAGSSYVLTGSNSITTKKPNTIHINNTKGNGTKEIYWILNNKNIDGEFELFPAIEGLSTEKEHSQEYQLQTGEYFIYSNITKTQLVMLGAGTVITRKFKGDAPKWAVDPISYDDFIEDWMVIFNDEMYKSIDLGINVYATEHQYVQLGPGNSVQLTALDKDYNYNNGVISINGVGTYLNGNTYSLEGFKISYSDENTEQSSLAYRNNSEYAWKAVSLLNLNCSPTSPQGLYANQTISLFDKDLDLIGTIEGAEDINHEATVRILTDREVALTGGINVDATTIDLLTKKIIPLGILSYEITSPNQQPADSASWPFKLNNNLQIELPIDNSINNTSLNKDYYLYTNLSAGEYILPITNDTTFDSLSISFIHSIFGNPNSSSGSDFYDEENELELLPLNDADDIKSIGTHYLKLNLNNYIVNGVCTGYLKFKVSIPDKTSNNINIGIPFKYKYEYEAYSQSEILHEIINLDKNNEFNYLYQIEEEVLIEDPLLSKSFTNSNHFYNPYTICQWDVENEDLNKIIIENKIK